ncbi:MAG: L,D-transpeptidase family protein [Anaerolineae bacterium]
MSVQPTPGKGILLAILLFTLAGLSSIYLYYRQPDASRPLGAALAAMSSPFPTQVQPTSAPTQLPAQTATLTPEPEPSASPTPGITATPSAAPTPAVTATPAWLSEEFLPLPQDKWLEVDLGKQLLTAHIGETSVFTAAVSSSSAVSAQAAGKYRIIEKQATRLLTGPGYYLPDVPWVMLLTKDLLLDGAYWLDSFGAASQYGSINLSPEDAQRVFEWTGPAMPPGTTSVKATARDPGTWVLVHP